MSNLDQILREELTPSKSEPESSEIRPTTAKIVSSATPHTKPVMLKSNKNSFYYRDYALPLSCKNHTSTTNKPKPRHFTRFVLLVSFLTAIFSIPYAV